MFKGTTADVDRPYVKPARVADCVMELMDRSDFTSPTAEVQKVIDDRWSDLQRLELEYKKAVKVKIEDVPETTAEMFE